MRRILLTGGAGFIGSHVVDFLLSKGLSVVVIDNFDSFYSRAIKENNISIALKSPNCKVIELDITNWEGLDALEGDFEAIIHLAAKAGVRPSIVDPLATQITNVNGTQNLLEFAKKRGIKQFIFASSSSVYGVNENVPWNEHDRVLLPISPYASTKVSGELLGHVYSHLYGIRFIALRFFTVFGPRQRPDLAIHKFTKLLLNNEPIPFFGKGNTRRDYTYVDDIVNGIFRALNYTESNYEIINLGNSQTVSLYEMLNILEEVFEKKAIINYLPEQTGDVPQTYANVSKAKQLLGYQPSKSFREGLELFKEWWYEVEKN